MSPIILPYAPLGSDQRDIDGVLANFDALLGPLNDLLGHKKPLLFTGGDGPTGAVTAGTFYPDLSTLLIKSGVAGFAPDSVAIHAADRPITGLTEKLRLRATIMTNATAPGVNFTYGLYPFTVSGGAGSFIVTLGTVVTGSTVTRNTPAANSVLSDVSGAFSLPADGQYIPGVVTSGSTAANSDWAVSWELTYHYV